MHTVLTLVAVLLLMALLAGAVWMWKAGMFEAAPSGGTPVVEVNKPNAPLLPEKPEDGVLAIAVNEPNPNVTVDGEKVAATWIEGGKKTTLRVRPGRRRRRGPQGELSPCQQRSTRHRRHTEVFTAELLPVEAGTAPHQKHCRSCCIPQSIRKRSLCSSCPSCPTRCQKEPRQPGIR